MLARSVRSGLAETYHDGVVAVCDPAGSLVAWSGEIDRPFYLRSSAKPFQAWVSQQCGADLAPVELALACASHRGQPAHVAIVSAILGDAGLSQDDLQCPADWPLALSARARLWRSGRERPRRIWHNCSGKHAGFLRACVARGWPTDGYLDAAHPLQRRVIEFVSEMGDLAVAPVGVDGCGAPVLRTNARAMATMFARLAVDPAMREVFGVMHRYPSLVSGNGEGDAVIATTIHAAAKGGAQGCIGVALPSGVGLAVKTWDGNHDAAVVGAVATLAAVGALGGHPVERLAGWARPHVWGGSQTVGELQPMVELAFR